MRTTAKQAAARARAKKLEAQRRECTAATYRQFVYATRGEVPPGNYYDASEEVKDTWRAQAEGSAKTLGLKPTTEPKEG